MRTTSSKNATVKNLSRSSRTFLNLLSSSRVGASSASVMLLATIRKMIRYSKGLLLTRSKQKSLARFSVPTTPKVFPLYVLYLSGFWSDTYW